MKEQKTAHNLILVALLTVSAYFLADTVDAMIGRSLEATPTYAMPVQRDRPGLQPQRTMSDYSSILERGLFGEGKGPSGGPAASAASSSYTLVGTVEGEVFAGAVLDDGTGQVFYRIHQRMPDGSSLVKVTREKVMLRRPDGTTVTIQVIDETKIVPLKNGSDVKRLSDGKFVVDQKDVLASTENMSQILTQARALPFIEQGKTVGFRISEITPGSIYEKIGLQNGDVIQKVNSQDVDDPAKFFQLYQGLKNEQSITIDLLRGGQRQTLNYEIR